MPSRRSVLAFATSLPWAAAPQGARGTVVPATGGRAALVIGNERYRHNPLRNAVNDARAMAALLTQAGFAVDLKLDATREQMTGAIDALGQRVAQRDVGTALFYYAGHAAQLDWRNYLLPVDSDVGSIGDVRKQCVDLGLLLDELGRARGKTALIIIDACRDDPFGPRFRAPQKGMGPYDAPPGTLLAFATAPGRVAFEMQGSNHGLYTEQLVRELGVKGVRIEDALKKVRLNVRVASRGRQVPWESTSLEGDVYLFPVPKLSEVDLERQSVEEYEAWSRIKASTRLGDWVDFVRRYPSGKFGELAQLRVGRLMAIREPSARPPVPAPTAALRLGPKLTVPSRFKGSGSPNSAGSYAFQPVWTPGDEYEFVEMDLYSGVVKQRYKVVVKRVDVAADRVELVDGSVLDLTGSVLKEGKLRRFEPALQVNPEVLQVGRKWTSHYRLSGSAVGAGDYEFVITERQMVKVPAGEFFAFRIQGIGNFRGRSARLVRWMVPGINLPVRREIHLLGTARELVSARQAVSS